MDDIKKLKNFFDTFLKKISDSLPTVIFLSFQIHNKKFSALFKSLLKFLIFIIKLINSWFKINHPFLAIKNQHN